MPATETRSLFRHRPFLFFWLARVFTASGYQMQSVAVAWQVYELTHSAFDLGLVGLIQFIPRIALISISGNVADRYDRRRVVLVAQAVQALGLLVLALASELHFANHGLIFALMLVIGAARSFEAPATQALLPGLVCASQLPRAVATAASAMQAATILAPALGGVLYALGATTVYGLTAALYATAALLTFKIHATPAPRQALVGSGFASFLEGLRFIRAQRAVLGAISLDLFAVLLGGATALLPVIARDILHTGPWGLGLLRAAPAVGALSMSIWLAHRPLQRNVGHVMFGAVALFGVATIVFGLSHRIALSVPALVVLGACDMISVVIRQAFVQLQTPDAMRGRVGAVNSVFIGASNQLGEFESGATAALFGAAPSVIIGGLGTLLVVAIWMRGFPELARVDKLH